MSRLLLGEDGPASKVGRYSIRNALRQVRGAISSSKRAEIRHGRTDAEDRVEAARRDLLRAERRLLAALGAAKGRAQ